MDTIADLTHAGQAGIANGHNRQQRQTDTGNAKTKKSPPDIRTGSLPHGGRENQVTSAEKQRKEHQTNRNKSRSGIRLHEYTLYLSAFCYERVSGTAAVRQRKSASPSLEFGKIDRQRQTAPGVACLYCVTNCRICGPNA